MITHLASENPRVAVCGAPIFHDPSPGPRTVCLSCTPASFIGLPVRIARPFCDVCGQPEGHWADCRRDAA